MFFFSSPSAPKVRALLQALADAPFTYSDVGATQRVLSAAPPGFVLDRYGTELGRGREVFERACGIVERLGNYPPSFTRIVWLADELHTGAMFATLATHLGFASVHPCRVIYIEREPDRFSLGFGTLPGHAESGEERFQISMQGETVRYDVQAFSRPVGVISRLGSPITRAYQRRFQRETVEWMRGLCRHEP